MMLSLRAEVSTNGLTIFFTKAAAYTLLLLAPATLPAWVWSAQAASTDGDGITDWLM